MSSIPIPININFARWADILREQFAPTVPQLTSPDGWKDWARYVVCSSQLSGLAIPPPDGYTDPMAWAMAFWRAYERGT